MLDADADRADLELRVIGRRGQEKLRAIAPGLRRGVY